MRTQIWARSHSANYHPANYPTKSACSARGAQDEGRFGDHCGEARVTATAPGYWRMKPRPLQRAYLAAEAPSLRDHACAYFSNALFAYQHALNLAGQHTMFLAWHGPLHGYIRYMEGMEATGRGLFALQQEGTDLHWWNSGCYPQHDQAQHYYHLAIVTSLSPKHCIAMKAWAFFSFSLYIASAPYSLPYQHSRMPESSYDDTEAVLLIRQSLKCLLGTTRPVKLLRNQRAQKTAETMGYQAETMDLGYIGYSISSSSISQHSQSAPPPMMLAGWFENTPRRDDCVVSFRAGVSRARPSRADCNMQEAQAIALAVERRNTSFSTHSALPFCATSASTSTPKSALHGTKGSAYLWQILPTGHTPTSDVSDTSAQNRQKNGQPLYIQDPLPQPSEQNPLP
ncbi:hypothetical protein BDR22DRAFT_825090 [Usnea florida]